jgi:hypothetical protein
MGNNEEAVGRPQGYGGQYEAASGKAEQYKELSAKLRGHYAYYQL